MRRKAVVIAGVGLAVGAAIAAAGPSMRRMVRRWLTASALTMRTAARAVAHQGRRLRAEPSRRHELDVEFQIRSAEDVVATLGQMKGTFMKLGQLVSFVDDAMPEHIRAVLSQLQDSVPPMAAGLAADVIESELGQRPERLFKTWTPTPVAAASIGQVHRAVLHDGRVVAVKVQYPGIADLMEADLAQLDLGRFIAPALWPNLDIQAVTAEWKVRLREELDYSIEATNQRDFAAWYSGHPFIRVPAVVDELSTSKVLTTAFADGERFAAFEQRDQPERDLAAEAIFRFVFRSLHDYLAFNGDPHPGNYLFHGGGAVTFVDFGLVKRLSPQAGANLVDTARYVVLEPNPAKLRRLCEDIGYFIPGNPLTDEQIFDFSAVLWSHLDGDAPRTLTPEWASETVRTYLLKGPEFKDIDRWGGIPTDFVILQRITVGLLAILGRLNATANWHRIARELWMGEPPASPLGEREAEWRAAASATPSPA